MKRELPFALLDFALVLATTEYFIGNLTIGNSSGSVAAGGDVTATGGKGLTITLDRGALMPALTGCLPLVSCFTFSRSRFTIISAGTTRSAGVLSCGFIAQAKTGFLFDSNLTPGPGVSRASNAHAVVELTLSRPAISGLSVIGRSCP